MSKTAQRKRSAYANGYHIGRYGWPSGVNSYRLGVIDRGTFDRGIADGKRDRRDHYRPTRTFWQALKFVFGWGRA